MRPMELMAKEHWEEYLPKRVASLKASGQYRAALSKARENCLDRTSEIAEKMEANGADPAMAWKTAEEIALKEFILLPPEPGR